VSWRTEDHQTIRLSRLDALKGRGYLMV
jgi:hypothetical protein